MISIQSTITIPKITMLYLELEEKMQVETVIDLRLPKKIEKLDFGVLFSLIQFIATWVRCGRSGNLLIPVKGIEEAKTYLFDSSFVYPAIAIAWEKEIVDVDGSNLRTQLKIPSQEYFRAMDFFSLKEKLSVPIYCFDHDKSKRGFSRHFYNNKNELLPEDSVGFNLYPGFLKIGSLSPNVFRANIKKNLDSFIAIIHELFANTHEHAKTNANGHNLYPNIRAINLKFHRKTLSKYTETYKDLPGLVEYFESDFNVNSQGELYLIELSILDSGPGLVKRYKSLLNYNFSINEEVEMIKECLYRHNTSAKGLKEGVKGIGLDRVLQTIDGKGFVRIKSGRADIFRNMKKFRYRHHEKADDLVLYDWQKNSSSHFVQNPEAQGTLISIFFPLEYI